MGKNQAILPLNWQSTNPTTGFLPLNNNTQGKGSIPSGVLNGAMASTNTIYSQIFDVSRMDNLGLEVNYNYDATGTAVGTISVNMSNSGLYFYPVTFTPVLAQPAGAPGGYGIDLSFWPWKYLMISYVNSSGTGVLTMYLQEKAVGN